MLYRSLNEQIIASQYMYICAKIMSRIILLVHPDTHLLFGHVVKVLGKARRQGMKISDVTAVRLMNILHHVGECVTCHINRLPN